MTTSYVLTAAAESDLRNILHYSRKQWGDAQAHSYIAKMKNGVERIVSGEGKEMGRLHPRLRMLRCEHHYIFCLPRENGPALIVAILHERMDVLVRLGNRLGG